MRTVLHWLLMGFVVAALIEAPITVSAAPVPAVATSSIGIILQADHAFLAGGGAVNGASIYDGDALQTNASGSLRMALGKSQAFLTERSSASFHHTAQGLDANLTGGTIVLSAAQGENFLLHADGAEIRPGAEQMTVAQVTLVSSNELLLSARKGPLEVTAESEVKTIPEGASYRLIIQPPDPAAAADPQFKAGRNRLIWLLITGAIVATTIIVVLAVVSPAVPTKNH